MSERSEGRGMSEPRFVLVFAVPIMVVLIGGPVMLAAGVLCSRAAA